MDQGGGGGAHGEQWVSLGVKLDVLGDGRAGAEGGVSRLPVPSLQNWKDGSAIL